MASRLLLIRHADTGPANRERLVGSTDITASPSGLDAVGRLAAVLERFAPESWYCSPMLRARQTADRLGPGTCPPAGMVIDERLREIDFGSWEMRRLADILSLSDPDLIKSWSAYESFVFRAGKRFRPSAGAWPGFLPWCGRPRAGKFVSSAMAESFGP